MEIIAIEKDPTFKEIKNPDVQKYYRELFCLTLSELHKESVRIATGYLNRFPTTWKEELKVNPKIKAIQILIKKMKGVGQ